MTNKDDLKVAEEIAKMVHGNNGICFTNFDKKCQCIEKIAQALATQRQQLIGEMVDGVEKLIPPYKECKCDPPIDVCFIRVGVRKTREKVIRFIKSKLTEE